MATDNTEMPTKTSITQQLRTDLGPIDAVFAIIQLVWLTESQPSH